MKLFAPKYYNEFKCIADKCTHSCCIGWEIDIDDYTLEKYSSLDHKYGEAIRKSIEITDTPHFILGKNERCPHLSERGLCEIISNVGEGYLCDICREHPRFYNDTCLGKEVGLGMACEEACRIILNSDDYLSIVEIGEVEEEAIAFEFNATHYRQHIYSILSDRSVAYVERLKRIYDKLGACPNALSDNEWKEVVSQLEYLDPAHKEMFMRYSSALFDSGKNDCYLERALAYFIYRHCTEAYDENDFCARLFFCLFCERLLASVCQDDIFTCARIISEELEYSLDNTEAIMNLYDFDNQME